jgi:DNA segregation ATPase FtsK/SpoIIIE-like protein
MSQFPDPERSRAVLIGTGRYHPTSGLNDLPGVLNNLVHLRDVLTHPDLGGFHAEHCRIVAEPASALEVDEYLQVARAEATDTLLVYYAGHGLVEDDRFYLTLTTSRTNSVRHTCFDYDHIRRALIGSRARTRVVLLDSCYSGQALGLMSADNAADAGLLDIEGTYLLTSSAATAPSKAPVGGRFTAFTEELLDHLRRGDPDGPEGLTLQDTYEHLLRTTIAKGLPRPQQRNAGTAAHVALVRNRALLPGAAAEDAPPPVVARPLVLDQLGSPAAPHRLVPFGLAGHPGGPPTTAVLDLDRRDHLLAVGAPGSGLSQLLKTLGASLARQHSTADVHLYVFDAGLTALTELAGLPHCGGVVTWDQAEHAARLFGWLAAEVSRRAVELAAAGYADLAEQRAAEPDAALPYLVTFIDRWETFRSLVTERVNAVDFDARMTSLVRQAHHAGLRLVITGGPSLPREGFARFVDGRLQFRSAEPADFQEVGVDPRSPLVDLAAGQALAKGGVLNRVALLVADPSPAAQDAALRALAGEVTARDAGVPAAARPWGVTGTGSRLPRSVPLLELLDLEPPTAEGIARLWQEYGRTASAPIGAAADGTFDIDLTRDGPHGLVAGTTGAGKSELLQAIVASLAARNRPDAMIFVLIDYKGGASLADLVDLPHMVGMVTDLDGHLTERALASLNAELKRRETILGTVGAKNIEDYWDIIGRPDFVSPYDRFPGERPMDALPRTVLVIDEFDSMVEDLPDFVTGLVRVARRGRSLGVHLIVATQRPAGVVSPLIRANTTLRIALRVTDEEESADMIGVPDAAFISRTTPGRGYARTDSADLRAFQAGHAGRRREDGGTDLQALVGAIAAAAQAAGIGRYRSPWLPALPEQLTLDSLPAPAAGPHVAAVPYALEDLPEEQAQRPVRFDLEHGGHLVIAGAPRAGRSTALRTLAGSIARYTSSRDVHLYGLDCGNGALAPLVDLPHCGAVVTHNEAARVERLLAALLAEVARRQTLLTQDGFGSLAEQRAGVEPAERLPYLVLLLDRWEGFTSALESLDGGALTDRVHQLLREGPGVGLRVVMTADRSGLAGRLSTMVEDKLVMRMADRGDYTLAGLPPRALPESMPAGRAFRIDPVVELQFALLDADPAGRAQVAALAAIARAATERDADVPRTLRPARVDVLPSRIMVREVLALWAEAAMPPPGTPMWALVGAGGDELRPLGVDLDHDGPGFVIGGPSRSGRSTALRTVADSLLAGGCDLVVITPRVSPLRALAGQPGVVEVFTGSPTAEEVLDRLDACPGPAAVLVDDGELLLDAACMPALETVLAEGRDGQRALVVAGTTAEMMNGYRGYIVEARRTKTGLLLAPEHPMEGELLGIKPPRSAVGPVPKGRGLLVIRGAYSAVQVPMLPV